ncbi:MAG: WD40/YVTN/BNR-like repeat-containing protein, partial [Terriglobales bacterium]
EQLSIEILGISATNPHVMVGKVGEGLWRTDDGARTWRRLGSVDLTNAETAPKRMSVMELNTFLRERPADSQIVLDPSDDKILYVVYAFGVARSSDGGASWCLLNFGFDQLGSVTSLAINPLDPYEIFVGSDFGVFRSIDRGNTFRRIYPLRI